MQTKKWTFGHSGNQQGPAPCSFVSFRAESAEPRDPGFFSVILSGAKNLDGRSCARRRYRALTRAQSLAALRMTQKSKRERCTQNPHLPAAKRPAAVCLWHLPWKNGRGKT